MAIHFNTKQKKAAYLFALAILFRLLMYVASYICIGLSKSQEVTYTLNDFLDSWTRWDAVHYLNIAADGYAGTVENGQHLVLVFYPLYSLLVGFFKGFMDLRIAGLMTSTLMYSIGCIYLYFLVEMDFSETVAKYAVILISVFPYSFFYGGIMTESLFFALSAAMLYYIRSHKWLTAAIVGIFVTMSRTPGILLIIPAFFEVLREYQVWNSLRKKEFMKILKAVGVMCIMALMFLGTAMYLYINWKVEGNPFQFMIYQRDHWYQTLVPPTTTLRTLWSYGTNPGTQTVIRVGLWYPEILFFIVSIGIIAAGIKKVSSMYISYGIAYVWLTYSASWLMSGGRYLSVCIPLFVILAVRLEKRKNLRTIVLATMAVFMGIYMMGFFLGKSVL